ncbi:hypothetical protein Acsp04_01890 [Actinomadura sp. NBRC 104425]|uniref:hypothetical protein n=1 Tax=Actinomadura sp. NBRC 104425 TaxID=3032204 RepID=UPI0024A1FA7F|nr:hypothetical protein [Actinomadura sp. NBRC 104425]GLZ09954.1 hypothetical protein Acsp04_01890 [Actinomadura sp. NBRC 104425]
MEDRSDDFGITALAGGYFHQAWWSRHPTSDELLMFVRDENPVPVIEQCVHDATLLAESPLTGEQLAALWTSATDGYHAVTAEGRDGRRWFQRMIEILTPKLDAAGVRVSAEGAQDFRPEVTEPVARVVRRFSIVTNFLGEPADEQFLRQALEDLIRAGLPELSLRFFLRFAVTHDAPIPKDFYAEIKRASVPFGYGAFIVERLEHLIID